MADAHDAGHERLAPAINAPGLLALKTATGVKQLKADASWRSKSPAAQLPAVLPQAERRARAKAGHAVCGENPGGIDRSAVGDPSVERVARDGDVMVAHTTGGDRAAFGQNAGPHRDSTAQRVRRIASHVLAR